MVEVFRTDVETKTKAADVIDILHMRFPSFRINFDLEDSDRILRIEGDNLDIAAIAELLKNMNIFCEVLQDEVICL
jgi:DNA-binding transcriptional LysR family regulator